MTIDLAGIVTNAIGSFIGGLALIWLTLGRTGISAIRSRVTRPTILSAVKRAPADILFELEVGAPMERVKETLGSPSRTRGKWWGYRYTDALVSIEFAEDNSLKTIALGLTNQTAVFSVPLFEDLPPLGELTLEEVMMEGSTFEHRDSARHDEILAYARYGPPGAWVHYTFGAISPHSPGDLRLPNYKYDTENDALLSAPKEVFLNWVGISGSSEPAWFPWDLGLRNVGN